MKRIIYETLTLQGFGPFSDEMSITFHDGLNNIVAANESGKSSTVAGLLATVFGLPKRSDPEQFGTERFKNWDDPATFRGSLFFTRGDERYLLKRNFDNHNIELRLIDSEDEIIETLMRSEHNPNARKPNERYEDFLRETFGMKSRAAYERTFCISQPMPEDEQLSGSVQRLLSGGDVISDEVLETISEDLKEITIYTGDRGVTPRNLNKDRELERVEEKIVEIKRQIEDIFKRKELECHTIFLRPENQGAQIIYQHEDRKRA